MHRAALLIATAFLACLAPAEAQFVEGVEAYPPPGYKPPERPVPKLTFKDHEETCPSVRGLKACVREIAWLDAEIARRVAYARRTGTPVGNAGWSLVGCSESCVLRYFPHETKEECRTSRALFRRIARTDRAFARTHLRERLGKECGRR